MEELGSKADPASASSPKLASPKAPAKLSASDLSSKITRVMPKTGVNGKDSKKAEPHSKKGGASKDPPLILLIRVAISLIGIGLGPLSLPKRQVFTGDPNKQSWLSFISKFERIFQRRKWTAQKRLIQLFKCLSETRAALEYVNRYEGQNDFVQLRAELARRFYIGDTLVAARHIAYNLPKGG